MALKNKARVLEHEEDIIISPVDGRILNFGKIKQGTLIQAKGLDMSLADMLSGTRYHQNFINGTWITIYLSPQDYHRIHSPVSGDIVGYSYLSWSFIPGKSLCR